MKSCPLCKEVYPRSQSFCIMDGTRLSHVDPYRLLGSTLSSKYQIHSLVDIGGTGVVYRAYDTKIGRDIAVKVLKPDISFGRNDNEMLQLFIQEVRFSGQLNHKNIITIFDAGISENGLVYIAMEWLDGYTVGERLNSKGPFSLEDTAIVLRQISSALDAIHKQGLIHRDIKPNNIMLATQRDGSEQVKLIDFGISLAMDDGTSVSKSVATPQYASPEQMRMARVTSGLTDIYSLGIVLYEMITGKLPFDADSAVEYYEKQVASQPVSICNLCPNVPIELNKLIMDMLAARPDERPQSASEVVARFDSSLSGLSSPKIFISYAREDEDKVLSVYNTLKTKGFRPWIDKKEILPGMNWDRTIKENLKKSDFLIVCLSSKSLSKRGYVQQEVKIALDLAQDLPMGSIFLIPIRLDECLVPSELAIYQYIDWFNTDSLDRLAQAISSEWSRRSPSS